MIYRLPKTTISGTYSSSAVVLSAMEKKAPIPGPLTVVYQRALVDQAVIYPSNLHIKNL
jgi:hypothetical protein